MWIREVTLLTHLQIFWEDSFSWSKSFYLLGEIWCLSLATPAGCIFFLKSLGVCHLSDHESHGKKYPGYHFSALLNTGYADSDMTNVLPLVPPMKDSCDISPSVMQGLLMKNRLWEHSGNQYSRSVHKRCWNSIEQL